MQQSSEAIVLRTIPYSDTSLIVRLFTKEFGKITVIAKGARRPKNPLGSILEPLVVIEASYYYKPGRDIQTLANAQMLANSEEIRKNYHKITAGLSMLELLDRATQMEDAHPVIYRLITAAIKELSEMQGSIKNLFWFYLYHLSVRLGFKPNLNHCHQCGEEIHQAAFNRDLGELICQNCNIDNRMILPQAELQYLRQLSVIHIDKLDSIKVTQQTENDAGQFLVRFLSHHIEGLHNMKSLKIFLELN